jgi:CRP-like cAMP-binding protein
MSEAGFHSPLVRKFQALGPWTDSELFALGSFGTRRRRIGAHQAIFHERDASDDAYLVQSGWTCVYKLLPDGGRQVISFPLPGDIVGISGLFLDGAQFTFESLTPVEISPISTATLLQGATASSNVARAVRWSVARDSAILVEHLVNVGRRSALMRTAHFILELALRLRLIGAESRGEFACPVNQYWMADALGLTAIHLNRVLRELREAQLVTVRAGHVVIHDYCGLKDLAVFDGDYLSPPKRVT